MVRCFWCVGRPGGVYAEKMAWDRKPGFAAGAAVALRLLLRTSAGGVGMAELYVNDVMSHPYTFGGPGAALDALATFDTADGAIDGSGAMAWAMTLPAV